MNGEKKIRKGLIVEIYRNGHGDCSNGGLSARNKEALLVGPGIPEIFDETDRPVVVLVTKKFSFGTYTHAEPDQPCSPGHSGWMAGGCFIYSSDSRFPAKHPIALHDRQEAAAVRP